MYSFDLTSIKTQQISKTKHKLDVFFSLRNVRFTELCYMYMCFNRIKRHLESIPFSVYGYRCYMYEIVLWYYMTVRRLISRIILERSVEKGNILCIVF